MNDDKDKRIFLLEQRIGKLEALLNKSIARSPQQTGIDRDSRTEILRLMTGLEDRLNRHGDKFNDVCDQIDIHHGDLNKAYEIFGLVDTRLKVLERHDGSHNKMVRSIKAIIDVHDGQIERLLREVMRLDECYYHVFPERLAQDARLLNQLASLTSKPTPDAKPKKG